MAEVIGGTPKFIEGDDEVRTQKCTQAVMQICEQYDCVPVPKVTMMGNQISWDLAFMPTPRDLKRSKDGDKK